MQGINSLVLKACNQYLARNGQRKALDVNGAIHSALTFYVQPEYLLDINALIWLACNKYLNKTTSDINTGMFEAAKAYLTSNGLTAANDLNSTIYKALYHYLGLDALLYLDFQSQTYRLGQVETDIFTNLPGATSTGGAGFGTVQRGGVWTGIPANEPLVGDGGLGVWEARTNLNPTPLPKQMYSSGFADANVTVVNGLASPDGGDNASRLSDINPANRIHISLSASVPVTPGATYTMVFGVLKASAQTDAAGEPRPTVLRVEMPDNVIRDIRFNARTGSVLFGAGLTGSVTDMGSWWRVAAQFVTAAGTGTSCRLRVLPAHDLYVTNTGFVDIWFANLLNGPDINDPPILQTSGLPATRTAMEYSQVLPAGDATDVITVEYTGGTATFARSTLANPLLLPYGVSSGGAWVNKQIQRIRLRAA